MTDAATTLSRLIGPLRRSLLRSTRAVSDLPDIPDAQIEVLRALSSSGPLSPGALADELGLARSTVSNLVKVMVGGGLILRSLVDEDGRSTSLRPSAEATTLLTRYDTVSADLLTEAIAELSTKDRAHLAAALPALQELRDVLERRPI